MEKRCKTVIAAFIVLLLLGFGCAETSGDCPVDCGVTLECCDGLCVDLQNNDRHCGYCGRECAEGESCMRGECVSTCGDSGMICPSYQSCCDGECTDTSYNSNHCGVCGNQCAVGQVCNAGACETLSCDPACEGGETCCKVGTINQCVDLNTDRNNCGSCGNTCGLNEVCRDGECSADVCDPACPDGQRCCGGVCVDTQADMQNCGFCGNVCDTQTADGCTAGQCLCRGALECRADQKCCEGIGCRNVKTDPSNCGECGNQCLIGETCVEGECGCGAGPGCSENESCCSGVCIDTNSDPYNCGGCGVTCGDNGPDCVAGQCMCGSSPPCEWAGWFACMNEDFSRFQKCCDGVCEVMDEENCGACGNACAEGDVCQGIFLFQCVFSCSGP